MHIGCAEDDREQSDYLSLLLGSAGHSVDSTPTAAGFIDALKKTRYDLLLVDWVLPDGTGADILSWVRQNLGWELPIIVLTVREDEDTVCKALGAGADDYVVKPPKRLELLARIEAVARRVKHGGVPVLRAGPYELDVQSHKLSISGRPVTLTQKEFDLAVYLFQNPGKLFSREHLLNKIWGLNADVDTRTVDTHVSRVRKKMELDGTKGWKVSPVYGYGYRFDRVDADTRAA